MLKPVKLNAIDCCADFKGLCPMSLKLIMDRTGGKLFPKTLYCGVPGLPCLSKSFDSYIDLNFCYPVSVNGIEMRTKGFRHRVLSLPVEVWRALMETPPLWHATILSPTGKGNLKGVITVKVYRWQSEEFDK